MHSVCVRMVIGRVSPGQTARLLEDPCVLGTHAGGRSLTYILTQTPLTQPAAGGHSRRALPLEMSLQGALL